MFRHFSFGPELKASEFFFSMTVLSEPTSFCQQSSNTNRAASTSPPSPTPQLFGGREQKHIRGQESLIGAGFRVLIFGQRMVLSYYGVAAASLVHDRPPSLGRASGRAARREREGRRRSSGTQQVRKRRKEGTSEERQE